eukprot:1190568-Prorocentrum_minimum.AAC.4
MSCRRQSKACCTASIGACLLRVYSLSPCAIGACYGYILSPVVRLVPATGMLHSLDWCLPATGIFSLPLCDWCLLRVYSLSPCAIGACYGHVAQPRGRQQPFGNARFSDSHLSCACSGSNFWQGRLGVFSAILFLPAAEKFGFIKMLPFLGEGAVSNGTRCRGRGSGCKKSGEAQSVFKHCPSKLQGHRSCSGETTFSVHSFKPDYEGLWVGRAVSDNGSAMCNHAAGKALSEDPTGKQQGLLTLALSPREKLDADTFGLTYSLDWRMLSAGACPVGSKSSCASSGGMFPPKSGFYAAICLESRLSHGTRSVHVAIPVIFTHCNITPHTSDRVSEKASSSRSKTMSKTMVPGKMQVRTKSCYR